MKASSTIKTILLFVLVGCGAGQSDGNRGMLGRPDSGDLTGPQNDAEKAVDDLIQAQCENNKPCRFATENFGKDLVFQKFTHAKKLSYDRVFRDASETGDMVRGETPAWVITGLFLDGSEEVTVDFTVRRDVHGMTVDEISID